MIIQGFSNYSYIDGKVVRNSNGKVVAGSEAVKLKNDNGKWERVRLSRVKVLCGDIMQLPCDAKPIPSHKGYFADTSGNIYSFSSMYPAGTILKPSIGTNGYLRVRISKSLVEVHKLMAITFLDEHYIVKGLCCMHKDDNKLNPKLSNLKIGTYSRNNKDAYDRGLNKGNGLKKI